MKILFFGDSITDMSHDRTLDYGIRSYGTGYVFFVAGTLINEDPDKYKIVNRGAGGDRIVDLYARIKRDVWNEQPDVLTIQIGTNDVWHGLGDNPNGVELERWEKFYRMIIEETRQRLPKTKIIMVEPFTLDGDCTWRYKDFRTKVKEYAVSASKIAQEYDIPFVHLQEPLNEKAKRSDPVYFLYDGVHPAVAGAKLIADEWLKVFRTI